MFKDKGIKNQPTKLNKKVKSGPNKNKKKSIRLGKTNSFKIAFNPSAIGCKRPQKKTTFGPFRR